MRFEERFFGEISVTFLALERALLDASMYIFHVLLEVSFAFKSFIARLATVHLWVDMNQYVIDHGSPSHQFLVAALDVCCHVMIRPEVFPQREHVLRLVTTDIANHFVEFLYAYVVLLPLFLA